MLSERFWFFGKKMFIKELRNCNGKLFCVRYKNSRKQNQCFKLLFFKLNSHFGPSKNIWINSIHHKKHLFGCLFSIKAKKTHIDQGTFLVFLVRSEVKRLKNLQIRQLQKNFFSSVYVYNLLQWLFFISSERRYFCSKSLSLLWDFSTAILLLSLK